MSDLARRMSVCVAMGRAYLLSQIADGLWHAFHQLRHGPSWAWVTAAVGSSLAEFDAVPRKTIEAVMSLRRDDDGWSYNPSVPSDADTTLRVIQFLRKVGFVDQNIIMKAERFVLLHQQPDGGFTTYLPEIVRAMGYSNCDGWCTSQPCVTALAVNQIRGDAVAAQRAREYLQRTGSHAYWWDSHLYVGYETGNSAEIGSNNDPVETALVLLLKTKLGIYDPASTERLISLQAEDGSMPISYLFQIPRPHQTLDDLTGNEEKVGDDGIFSLCATIVAVERQRHLA